VVSFFVPPIIESLNMNSKFAISAAVDNPWEKFAKLTVNGVDVSSDDKIVLHRGQASTLEVEAPPTLASKLALKLRTDGGLIVNASPSFGDWIPPNGNKFTCALTPQAGKSGRIELVFYSREVTSVWERTCLVLSTDMDQEADAKIDGVAIPEEGVEFIGGVAKTLTLTPKGTSPITELPVMLRWVSGDGLVQADFIINPALGTAVSTHSWSIEGAKKNGLFTVDLLGKDMTTALRLPSCKLKIVRPASYSNEGNPIEIIDGVGRTSISSWGKSIFLFEPSADMVGSTINVKMTGGLNSYPRLPATYTVTPNMFKRFDISAHQSWTGGSLVFEYPGTTEVIKIDVVPLE
jgi:hypothetical protein